MSTFDHDYCNFDEAISVPNNQPMEIKKKVSRGRQCVSYGCLNYQYSIVDGQRVKSNRSFYCFPSDPNSKDEWCRLIKREDGRDGFKVTESTRLCDSHFLPCDIVNGRLNRKTAKPVLHSWNDFKIKKPRRPIFRNDDSSIEVSVEAEKKP